MEKNRTLAMDILREEKRRTALIMTFVMLSLTVLSERTARQNEQ